MLEMYLKEKIFKECIRYAVDNLKTNNFQESLEYIYKAMVQNNSSAEIQNLLGIFYEKKGDLERARKHYRASRDLEPTFKAAEVNLKRIISFSYNKNEDKIDYGDNK